MYNYNPMLANSSSLFMILMQWEYNDSYAMRMQYYLYDSPVFSRFPSWVCWLLPFSEQLSRSHDSPQSDLGIYTDHLLLSKIVGGYHCLNYSTNKRIRQDLLFKWKIKIYNPFRFAKNAGNLCYICNWKEVRSIKNELIYWGDKWSHESLPYHF